MTNFPTRAHWFDSVWPVYDDGYRILVPIHSDTDLEEIHRTVEGETQSTFMLIVEDFDYFSSEMPIPWRRIDELGEGGIPKNVWIGTAAHTQKEIDERMRRLVKIRARKLFVMLKKGHDQNIDLKAGLVAWRCSVCGHKDGYGRMFRPKECPSGLMCQGSAINPQIHWVVSMDPYKKIKLASLCHTMGVAFWEGSQKLEVPE